jgi:hypothetical protein
MLTSIFIMKQNQRSLAPSINKSIAKILTIFFTIFLANSAEVEANTLIWDNGQTGTINYMVSQPSAGQTAFNDFIITSATRLSEIVWTGTYGAYERTDDFTIRLYSDLNGQPDPTNFTEIFKGAPTSSSFAYLGPLGVNIYEYHATVNSLVSAGPIWMSIYSNNPDLYGGYTWYGRWSWGVSSAPTGNLYYENPNLSQLVSIPYETDFKIFSAVPVPSAVWLMGSGLLCFVRFKLRQHQFG